MVIDLTLVITCGKYIVSCNKMVAGVGEGTIVEMGLVG